MCNNIGVIVNIVKIVLIDPMTFDLSTPKSQYFQDIPRSFPIPSLNTLDLGSFVIELYCGQTDKQVSKQTDGGEHPYGISEIWKCNNSRSSSVVTYCIARGER